jgi:hypothetical protein
MLRALAKMHSISPYQQGRPFFDKKDANETHEDFEKRIWRERSHYDDHGKLFIPPMQFKKALENAAGFISMSIPGQGKAKYTKHFKAGVLVVDAMELPVSKDDVHGSWVFVPSDGKRGGSSRVMKCFPTVHEWTGEVIFHILDNVITEPVFKTHLEQAGNFIGLGVFRPMNGGYHGRFAVDEVHWDV